MANRARGFIGHMLQNKRIRFGIIGIVMILALLISWNRFSSGRQTTASSNSGRAILGSTQKKYLEINQNILIPIEIGNENSNIIYMVESAELQDSVIVKGASATAVAGKRFLVLNLKISNSQPQRVKLDTRDFVRLGIYQSNDRLAPALHNDPVELQPISDQYTRLGFSVSADAREFILYLGEIEGEKIEIPISFN